MTVAGLAETRVCICSDPENCTERVPGYRCKKDFIPNTTSANPKVLGAKEVERCTPPYSADNGDSKSVAAADRSQAPGENLQQRAMSFLSTGVNTGSWDRNIAYELVRQMLDANWQSPERSTEDVARTSAYWKAEHLAAVAENERLRRENVQVRQALYESIKREW